MTHIVDQIADAIVTLVDGRIATNATVYRDRDVAFDARAQLPAIDIRVGAEEAVEDAQAIGMYRAAVEIAVDHYVSADRDRVSSELLELRAETHAQIMVAPYKLGMAPRVQSVRPSGASEVVISRDTARPIGYLSTTYRIEYLVDLDSSETLS